MDKLSSYQSKENSEDNEEDEEEEEDDEESDKIIKNNNDDDTNLINMNIRPGPRNSLRTKYSKSRRGKEQALSPAEEEANEFIHNIPDHVALKLQADNFKVRANLAQVKDGFRNIRNMLEDKLDALHMAQKLNFEKVRFIIEKGGSKKMVAGLKKLIDGEDIDLNNVEEDVPDYIKNLPDLIDEKLKLHENQRKDELNQAKLEEQQMIDDEIGERFNVTNQGLKEFNPDHIKNDNNDANPWEVINTQTDYQYIPGVGVRMKNDKLTGNKNQISNKRNSILDKNNMNNLYNKRLLTEEHENIIVNKIAEKIFRTMKDNNFLDGMGNNQGQNIQETKEPTNKGRKKKLIRGKNKFEDLKKNAIIPDNIKKKEGKISTKRKKVIDDSDEDMDDEDFKL